MCQFYSALKSPHGELAAIILILINSDLDKHIQAKTNSLVFACIVFWLLLNQFLFNVFGFFLFFVFFIVCLCMSSPSNCYLSLSFFDVVFYEKPPQTPNKQDMHVLTQLIGCVYLLWLSASRIAIQVMII